MCVPTNLLNSISTGLEDSVKFHHLVTCKQKIRHKGSKNRSVTKPWVKLPKKNIFIGTTLLTELKTTLIDGIKDNIVESMRKFHLSRTVPQIQVIRIIMTFTSDTSESWQSDKTKSYLNYGSLCVSG